MAPPPVKREYLAEYVHGMGNNFYLINARSAQEIKDRYPLFEVSELDHSLKVSAEFLEWMRYFAGPGRPTDVAAADRSVEERRDFRARQQREHAALRARRETSSLGRGDWPPQYWVDIDDDDDFRAAMHEYWKDDVRYRELPPERRLK